MMQKCRVGINGLHIFVALAKSKPFPLQNHAALFENRQVFLRYAKIPITLPNVDAGETGHRRYSPEKI